MWLARALFLLPAALVTIGPAFPGDRETEQRDADSRQKLQVRRALGKDEALAPYLGDVWVEVRGTAVTLSGQLPSAALKQRALFLAGEVLGVGEVRGDDLQVVTPDGTLDLPSPFVEGVPPRGALAGNGRATQAPRKSDLSGPEPARPSSPPLVVLMPPVPIGKSSPRPAARPVVEMLPPRPLPDVPPDLASAVEALRRKDNRFRRLRAEVRQKRVILSGTVSRWDDVNDLANAVRRLPGVEAVVVDNVQVDTTSAR